MKSLHHSFDIELAAKYGIEEAILIHHFQHWINLNMRKGINERDGRTWTYQTRKEIAAYFPSWNEGEVRRLTDKLVEKEILIKGNYNKSGFDKTIWYSFKNQKMFTIGKSAKSTGKSANGADESAKPIPDTKPDTKTNNNNPAPQNGEVVVSSCLDKLKIQDRLKRKILKDYPDKEKVEQAVKRALAWKNRPSDEIGIMTALSKADEWIDNPTIEDNIESNLKYHNTLFSLDGTQIGVTKIVVGYNYIEFSRGTICDVFRVIDKDFKLSVEAYLEKLNNN